MVRESGGDKYGQAVALACGFLSHRLSSGFVCFVMILRIYLCWFE